MFRLLILLAVAMFLTLLVGGQDRGQVRQGLAAGPAPVAVEAPTALAQSDPVPEATLTAYVPVAAPAIRLPSEAPAAAPDVPAIEVVAETAPPPKPDRPTFTLSNLEPAPAPGIGSAAVTGLPVRYVRPESINVREGPSTGHPVVGRLERNEAVSVVAEAPDGWVRVRIEGDGIEGFVAARLLSDQPPAN